MHLGEGSYVEVFDINTEFNQLILCVKEPERKMTYTRLVTHKKKQVKELKKKKRKQPQQKKGDYFLEKMKDIILFLYFRNWLAQSSLRINC